MKTKLDEIPPHKLDRILSHCFKNQNREDKIILYVSLIPLLHFEEVCIII